LRIHFLKKKTWKNAIFVFIDPYRTRPGTGKTCSSSLHVTPPVEITPKTAAKFASLNSSILRVGLCARAGACKPRKFRGSFVGYFDVPESEVYTSEFTVRALVEK
jgi:hypothetical protein